MKTRHKIIIGIIIAAAIYLPIHYYIPFLGIGSTTETFIFCEEGLTQVNDECVPIRPGPLFPEPEPEEYDYSELLKGADKNIDIAHHIDIIPINSTKHAFSIKSINLNSDDSITVNFGGVNENFMTIPEFNYTRTFQVNDSFVFYCMPTESGYPSMGIYKYLSTHVIDDNLSYAFYHGDTTSQNEFECVYPEIIEQSVNIFDIQLTPEMLQNYGIELENENESIPEPEPDYNFDKTITVMGKELEYNLDYSMSSGTITDMQLNCDSTSLVLSISSNDSGVLTLQLQEKIIGYVEEILVDGMEWDKISLAGNTVIVSFPENIETIEIKGTYRIGTSGECS